MKPEATPASRPSWPGSASPQKLEQAIRHRAQQIYESGGKTPGHEVENWLRAETEVMREVAATLRHRTARIVVKVAGVTYTGEYDSQASDYQPGEFDAGQPLRLRFADGRMYIVRPNRAELEARIVSP